jgi:hypothetical protein
MSESFFRPTVNLARALKEDGHKIWGFVIYRCTYKDDDKWKSFMDHFRKEIERSVWGSERDALLEKLDITVLEDPSWEDAFTATIRDYFKEWCETAPEREQGASCPPPPQISKAWRYKFCIQVNSYALESFDEDADPKGFVNLILRPWISSKERDPPLVEKRPKPSWWKGTWPPPPDEYEPLEGNTEENVGWMMVDYTSLVSMYNMLRRWDNWNIEYRRPPIIATDGVSYQSHKR